ncbi:MAG: Cys-tRNA(Pro) deacylase [Tissierellia bacterium]|nr:Cys-tRNA(Pro) deacylase [Tissierellia bacterium]
MAKSKKTNAMRILDRLKIDYKEEIYRDDNEFVSAVDAAKQANHKPREVYKTIVTYGKSKEVYVFVIRGDRKIDLKKAANSVDEKSITMVNPNDLKDLTGYIKGGCTAIGMKKNYPVVLDDDAINNDFIYVSGGKRGVEIKIAPNDYIKATNAKVCDIKDEN